MKKRSEASTTALRRVLKRLDFPLEVMLPCVRWYVAYPLSLRHLEEMMAERGIVVDHSTVHCWALKLLPVRDAVFRRRKRIVARRWRMDETYVKINGQWKYLYRALDHGGETVDFLPAAVRARHAANIPPGRMARPEEIAVAMLFLASDDSSFVAGSELLVDAGMCSV
jgi:transposase-like protein